MGTPYKHVGSNVGSLGYLPMTIVYDAYAPKVCQQIIPTKIAPNETVTTPAECALVHRDHRNAAAAECSNVGGE